MTITKDYYLKFGVAGRLEVAALLDQGGVEQLLGHNQGEPQLGGQLSDGGEVLVGGGNLYGIFCSGSGCCALPSYLEAD